MEKILELPEGFRVQMQELLGDDYDNFIAAMQQNPAVSIKLNRRKCTDPAVIGYEGFTPVPWCRSGFYLPERPVFTLNPLLHAGAFYVQEAASMIYEWIAEKIVPMAFDTGKTLRVIDLCAAPGGKTTSLINAIPDGSTVVANEFIPHRAVVLKENLLKWGYPDIYVTNSAVDKFLKLPATFDIVAVDAPCSGEGMMRKEEVARSQWGPGLIAQCSSLQRDILSTAVEIMKPGGFLIYSTCTFNRDENEENLRWLVEEKGLVPVDLFPDPEWGILPAIDSNYPALRFIPHATHGEGLFAAVLRKETDSEIPAKKYKDFGDALRKSVKVIADGIPLSSTKGKDLIPTSESVLATNFRKGSLPVAEVDKDTALNYLRHEALRLDNDIPRGFVVIEYQGFPLGIVKNIGSRANNLYPSQWRIRNL